MASYQDQEVRLRVLEDKVDLLLEMATVTKREPSTLMPGEWVETKMSLKDLYRELKHAGIVIERVKPGQVEADQPIMETEDGNVG